MKDSGDWLTARTSLGSVTVLIKIILAEFEFIIVQEERTVSARARFSQIKIISY